MCLISDRHNSFSIENSAAMKFWSIGQINQKVNQTSLKALAEAYQGARAIREIEEQHFGGSATMIQPGMGKITDYFRTQLDW